MSPLTIKQNVLYPHKT